METKRKRFKCWNCEREYELTVTYTPDSKLNVGCPFCNEAGIADLAVIRNESVTVMRGNEKVAAGGFNLPEIIPTKKPVLPS